MDKEKIKQIIKSSNLPQNSKEEILKELDKSDNVDINLILVDIYKALELGSSILKLFSIE